MAPYCWRLSQVVDNFENRQGCYFLQVLITQLYFHLKTKLPADDCQPMPARNVLATTMYSLFENEKKQTNQKMAK